MRVNLYALFFTFLSPLVALAQQEPGILPQSVRLGLSTEAVPAVHAAGFDAAAALEDDLRRDADGLLPLYGRMVTVGASLYSNGVWNTLPNGDRIWRLKVISGGALGTDLFFEDMHLPPGATLHVYDPAQQVVLGAFLDKHMSAHGRFATEMVLGESCIVEYFEPAAVQGEGRFTIDRLSHAYRMVVDARASDACQVDVNCSEGEGWEAQRDAVVRIRVVIPEGTGWCTGVLMNNTNENCTPYILTALHCGLGATATNYDTWLFRFKYQRSGCGTGAIPQGNQMTGCVKRADSNDDGGEEGSDFLLVELNEAIPMNYNPYFAGWSVANVAVPSGKTIHHPSSDIKKISTFTSALQTSGWGVNNSHWRVVWSPTDNGAGVTEPGSSGSPIFDQNKRVIGTLTGGASCCTLNGCGSFTGPNQPDFYGKMSHHWTGNPNAPNQKLREWLNPGGGTTIFDGSYDPCGMGVGIEEDAASGRIEVYPNPSSDRFTVKYPEGVVRADRVEITDLSGRLIHVDVPNSSGKAQIDASGWSSGTYLVNVIAGGVRYAGAKLVVQGR